MIRSAFLLILLIVLSLSGTACGSMFLINGDSPILHRDPLCLDFSPWEENLDLHTMVFAS